MSVIFHEHPTLKKKRERESEYNTISNNSNNNIWQYNYSIHLFISTKKNLVSEL